ncbi:MAG: hypothetical protein ABJG68_15295 [Crocinitomicaceae bacterium]
MKKLILLITVFTAFQSYSQVYSQIGARSNALGNATLSLTDVWSVYNNPGAFGSLEHTAVGVSYENRFLLKELSTQSLAAGYHTENAGNFGIHFQQYGFNLYREMQAGFTYGMKFYDNFSGGVSINYHRIALGENYGTKNTVSAALGMFYEMNDLLSFSMRVNNLNRAKLAEDQDERLPTTFGLGVVYAFSEKAFWTVEAEKNLVHPINVKSGIEVQAHDIFAVRLGLNTYPFQASFGFGLKFGDFHLDMASMWHAQLGLSPSAGIHYEFK